MLLSVKEAIVEIESMLQLINIIKLFIRIIWGQLVFFVFESYLSHFFLFSVFGQFLIFFCDMM